MCVFDGLYFILCFYFFFLYQSLLHTQLLMLFDLTQRRFSQLTHLLIYLSLKTFYGYPQLWLMYSGEIAGLGKLCTGIHNILEIINFTNCCTQLFFNEQGHEHTFLVSYVKQLQEISHTCTIKQSVHQNFKTNNVACFSFYVYALHLMILNLLQI